MRGRFGDDEQLRQAICQKVAMQQFVWYLSWIKERKTMCFDTVLLNSQCRDTDKESNRLLAHLLLLQRFVSLLDEDSAVFMFAETQMSVVLLKFSATKLRWARLGVITCQSSFKT